MCRVTAVLNGYLSIKLAALYLHVKVQRFT